MSSEQSPFFLGKLFRSFSISAVIFILSLIVVVFTSSYSLKKLTLSRMELAVSVLDNQLDSTQKAAKELLSVVSEDCDAVQPFIMSALVKTPSIQSITLYKGKTAICSSYARMIGYQNTVPKKDLIQLRQSDRIVPGQVIMLSQQSNDQFTVMTSLQGFNFLGLMNLLNQGVKLHLNVDGIGLNSAGVLSDGHHNDDLFVASAKYPYTLSSSIRISGYLSSMLETSWAIILLILLLSFIVGAYYYHYKDEHNLKIEMKKALKNNEFTPFAQPIMDAQGQLVGCEILLRWNSHHGLIQPDSFIPTAERSELIVPMTLNLLENVYDKFVDNAPIFDDAFHLSINISPSQLFKENADALIEHCKAFTSLPKFKNIQLVLEVTERQVISQNQDIIDTISRLHDIGVKLAIDDFGTGYSTMENLRDFKIDYLKIDKGFINLIQSDVLNADLLDNMIDLSKRLEIPVIAEGVETYQQAVYLVNNNVEFMQGYLYSKPVPLNDFLNIQ